MEAMRILMIGWFSKTIYPPGIKSGSEESTISIHLVQRFSSHAWWYQRVYKCTIIYQIYPLDIPIASKSIVDGHQNPVIVDGSDGRCLISIGLKTNGIIPKQSLGCRTEDFVLGPKSDYELLGTVIFCSLCWFKVKPVKKGLNILWFLCQSHCFFCILCCFSFCFPAFLMFFPTCFFIKDQTHGTQRSVDFLHVVTTLRTKYAQKKNTKQSNSSIFLCTSTQDVLRPSPQGLKWCFEFHYVPHISIPIKSPLNPTKSLEHLHSITIFDVSLVLPPWFSEPGSLGQRLPAPWHWRATRWSNSLWRKKTRRRCWTWPNGWMRSSRLATATTRKYGKTSVWKWSAPPQMAILMGIWWKWIQGYTIFRQSHIFCVT